MEQAKTAKDPFILREFEADGNSHPSTDRSSFFMSQLQNLAMVCFENQETDDCKKVFDKGKYNVIDQASFLDENPGYATKDTNLNEVKKTLDIKKARPQLMIKSIVW